MILAALLAGIAPLQEPVELTPAERARVLALSPVPAPPSDTTNAFETSDGAALLGRAIFHDERFSKNGNVSCATCHQPERDFTDGRPLGFGMSEVRRNTPTLWNVAHNRWFFWDGRADSLWAQALGPLEDPKEHGGSRLQYAHLLADDARYRQLYERVFGPLPNLDDEERFPPRGKPWRGVPEHPYARAWNAMVVADRDAIDRVFANVGKSLAAYQRRLVPGPAPFDAYVAGLREGDATKQGAISTSAVRGLQLFLGKGRCHTCHDGPLFTDLEFHDTRVPPLRGKTPDEGRYLGIPHVLEDPFNGLGRHSDDPRGEARTKLAYLIRTPHAQRELKTPSLRNVARTAPYMAQGQLTTLEDVVRFYSRLEGALEPHRGEKLIEPLNLTDSEEADLVAFLHTLTSTTRPDDLLGPPPGWEPDPRR